MPLTITKFAREDEPHDRAVLRISGLLRPVARGVGKFASGRPAKCKGPRSKRGIRVGNLKDDKVAALTPSGGERHSDLGQITLGHLQVPGELFSSHASARSLLPLYVVGEHLQRVGHWSSVGRLHRRLTRDSLPLRGLALLMLFNGLRSCSLPSVGEPARRTR